MEGYVSKEEFVELKKQVQDIMTELNGSKDTIHEIDKKLDVIIERISNSDKNLENRIEKLEETQSWLTKTTLGAVIGIAIKVIFDISKLLWYNNSRGIMLIRKERG